MAEYVAELSWSLGDAELAHGKYNTNHRMTFSGGLAATMTSAPDDDRAVAVLGKTQDGRTKVAAITLHPVTEFEREHEIPREELERMHERAHRYCFVANALSCEMRVEL